MDGKQKNEKRVAVANFNIVFTDVNNEERPLLDCFDSIVMPALNSGIERQQGNNTYLLMNIEIKQDSAIDTYCLLVAFLFRYSKPASQ